MNNKTPPFVIRHARLVLFLTLLNCCFGFLNWKRGVGLFGVIATVVIPFAVLVCLYWILRDGHFFDPSREEDDPEYLIAYDTKPAHYWTIVILCVLVYSGMTFLTGVAAFGETR